MTWGDIVIFIIVVVGVIGLVAVAGAVSYLGR